MAWGAIHNVVQFFGEDPEASARQLKRPFFHGRRYAKSHYLSGGWYPRRVSPGRLETALGLQVLWFGREM